MPVQLVSTALAADIRQRAAPASLHSIPTNANNQDIVTMGGIAALKNLRILDDLTSLIAIQMLGLCQAVDLRNIVDDLGQGTSSLYRFVRERSPFVDEDRALSEEIEDLTRLLKQRRLHVAECVVETT